MKAEYKAVQKEPAEIEGLNQAAHECPTPNMGDNVCRPLVNKVCNTCKEVKNLNCFYFNRSRNTYFAECKECNKSRASKWNKTNKARYDDNCKKHKASNPELYTQYKRKEYKKNIQRYIEHGKKYRESQHGRGVRQALSRERELRKRFATPKWLTQEQRDQMKLFFINRPEGHHVDHIVPISGETVSGLHVPWNLQYLPAAENIAKRNKLL